ncbi:MAG: anthranilate synthase component I family protein [Ruminococcus sp.]|nr:anthranilate synthase component I family protein [Ruminococcus sp.]
MSKFMKKSEFQSYKSAFTKIPVYGKFTETGTTSETAFLRLKNISEQCFILESAAESYNSKWSFIGFSPAGIISSDNTTDPINTIREFLSTKKSPKIEGLPPFTGGLAGYFSYDFIKYTEPKLHFDNKNSEHFRDFDLMIFDKIAAFNNKNNEIFIIVNGGDFDAATAEIERIYGIISGGDAYKPQKLTLQTEFTPAHTKEQFCTIVQKTKDYIKEGDIFQAVLSNRLEAQAQGSLFEVFRKLKAINPSPYMLYFSSGELEIAGSAPETLISVKNSVASTFPLAGTRPRGKTPDEDNALERELLADEKELAEHNMLVDLGRNDLGKICEIGTVKVTRYKGILRFSHVMHIGSEVCGTLRDDRSAIDAIAAALPAGTLSGAPKIRACEIIEELEECGRGIYGGAIGYLSYTGDADVCIAIRLAFMKNGKLYIRSGAGIVADSVPETEFNECENKLLAVKKAIEEVCAP